MRTIAVTGAGGFGREMLYVMDAINAVEPTWAVAAAVDDAPSRDNLKRPSARDIPHLDGLSSPTAIGSEFRRGYGCIALGRVPLGTNVRFGDHVHLNAHAVIGHDLRLLDFVSVHPNATVSGDCAVGPRTLLGAACTVLQQLAIGADVTVGAAACITRSTPDRINLVRVPTHPLKRSPSA